MKTDKTFLSVFITLLILAAIFFFIERIAGRGRNRAQPVFRRGWFTDVIYWFTTILITKPFVRLMLLLPFSLLILAKVTSINVLKMGTYTGYGQLSRQSRNPHQETQQVRIARFVPGGGFTYSLCSERREILAAMAPSGAGAP